MSINDPIIESLEAQWTGRLEAEGRNAIYQLKRDNEYDFDYVRDTAIDAIEKAMFDSTDWEPVKTTDISDIACDIGNRVAEEYWTFNRYGEEKT